MTGFSEVVVPRFFKENGRAWRVQGPRSPARSTASRSRSLSCNTGSTSGLRSASSA